MFTVEQIEQALEKLKSGADFPKYTQKIKEMGVYINCFYLSFVDFPFILR